jgi:hypothetical protein
VKLTHRPPQVSKLIERDKQRYRRALYTAAQNATDSASREAQGATKAKISQVGLGRLAGAIGQTSSKRKSQKPNTPYGAIYARGGDQSRAGQALESYTRGATIRPKRGEWLAFPTAAVPRTLNRRRVTPMLYRRGGLQTRIGPLQFVQINSRLAFLVVKNVTLDPKTYRAKRAGKGKPRTRVPAKEVIAFVLIRVTRRAVRFDKDRVVGKIARTMPDRLREEMDKLLPG